ncbi:hypothetical protein RLOatenuis_8600 [Rickettsiales bacterium]|nr:hypothetical protein RLOatenuis_8600 [Rickettsiales bacterium]
MQGKFDFSIELPMKQEIADNLIQEVNIIKDNIEKIIKELINNLGKSDYPDTKDRVVLLAKFTSLQITLIKLRQQMLRDCEEEAPEDLDSYDEEILKNYLKNYLGPQ